MEIKINNLELENKSLKMEALIIQLKLSNEQNQKLLLQNGPNSTNRNLINSNDNICNLNEIKIEVL